MSFNGINVNHIRGGARTYPATSLVGCVAVLLWVVWLFLLVAAQLLRRLLRTTGRIGPPACLGAAARATARQLPARHSTGREGRCVCLALQHLVA
jgi:hypothetical protein